MKRILVLLLIFLTMALSACERDLGITDQLLLQTDPNVQAEVMAASEIPDWLKAKIWRNEDALVTNLLALEKTDREKAVDLSNQIVNRRKKEWIYRKWIDAEGTPILGTSGVRERDFIKAREIVVKMSSKRPWVRRHLSADAGFYVVLFDPELYSSISKLPESYDLLYGINIPVLLWVGICQYSDRIKVAIAPAGNKVMHTRVRFDGVTCKEMGYDTDHGWCYQIGYPNWSWTSLIHEFAHAMHFSIRIGSPNFDKKLNEAYEHAMAHGLWTVKGSYGKKNAREYWATNTEHWFVPKKAGGLISKGERLEIPEISQRTLKTLDPKLYALLSYWYPSEEIDKH